MDKAGNLTSRTDARNVTTTYTFDPLNRNIRIEYDDADTPDTERHYDGAVNGKGRLLYDVVGYNYGANPDYIRTVIGEYDAAGRVKSKSQGYLYWDGQALGMARLHLNGELRPSR